MVRVVEWMQRRGGIRVHELERKFDLDPRSMRRYLADLKDLGLPVLEEGRGETRSVYLDPAYRRSGIQLTLGEMISLRLGASLFNFLQGTSFAEDMDQAIDRLEPTVSRGSQDMVQNFDTMFVAVPKHAKDYRGMGDMLNEILSALLYSERADAQYRPPRGRKRNYQLEPLTLACYRQGLYLFARDVDKKLVKTFAVERFLRFQWRRQDKFKRPENWNPKAFVADAFGITGGEPRAVVVRFNARVAEFIRERQWHPSQGLLEREDGSVEVLLRCAITPELRQWILGFGADAEVLEPEELRIEVRRSMKRGARLYRKNKR